MQLRCEIYLIGSFPACAEVLANADGVVLAQGPFAPSQAGPSGWSRDPKRTMLGCCVKRNSKRFGRSTPTPHLYSMPMPSHDQV